MATTSRPARWWEHPETADIRGCQGKVVSPQGRSGVILCPFCGAGPVVYNGNYFCDNWAYPAGPDDCTWALAHPAKLKRDRDICDLIGIDYH